VCFQRPQTLRRLTFAQGQCGQVLGRVSCASDTPGVPGPDIHPFVAYCSTSHRGHFFRASSFVLFALIVWGSPPSQFLLHDVQEDLPHRGTMPIEQKRVRTDHTSLIGPARCPLYPTRFQWCPNEPEIVLRDSLRLWGVEPFTRTFQTSYKIKSLGGNRLATGFAERSMQFLISVACCSTII
jgi:hypothetical protein